MQDRPFHKAIHAKDIARERAKNLRARTSIPERILWSRLRRKQVAGLRFRRQHPIGPYIVDFYCHQAAMVVEIDGVNFHIGDRYEHDKRRHEWLMAERLLVLRFSASSVSADVDDVVGRIRIAAVDRVRELDLDPRDDPEGDGFE